MLNIGIISVKTTIDNVEKYVPQDVFMAYIPLKNSRMFFTAARDV